MDSVPKKERGHVVLTWITFRVPILVQASASEATGNSVAAQTAEQAAASLAEREATWAAEVRQIHGQLGDSQHQVQLLGTQLQQQQQEAAILQDKLQSLESRDLSASASLQVEPC